MKSKSFDFYQHLQDQDLQLREKNKLNNNDDPEIIIDFILPTKDVFPFDLTGCSHLYVKDIKYKLYMKGIGIHPLRMNFLCGRKLMKDEDLISHYSLVNKGEVHVLLKVIGVPPLFFNYDEFLTSITPNIEHSRGISIRSEFELVFQPNLCHHIVNVESLINRNCLKTIYYDADRQKQVTFLSQPEQIRPFLPSSSHNPSSSSSSHSPTSKTTSLADAFNLVSAVANPSKDNHTSMLFQENKKWTNYAPETNILLLKVEETLSLHLHRILYNIEDVLNGRKEVDDDSWQRYTNVLPIDCNVIIENNYREYPMHVKLVPYQPLEYNTFYAVFLKCGVATIPAGIDAKWSFEYLSDGIGWDKLIIYKTEAPPSG